MSFGSKVLWVAVLCASCGPASVGDGHRGAPRRSVAALEGAVSAGDGARYAYDGAGNLVEVAAAAPASAVTVLDFNPPQGGPGELVAVYGTGFSPDPSANAVQLAGAAASVVSATANELVLVVPAGASTGRIAVTSGGATGTSAQDFTVLTGVVVAGFTPRVGRVGTILTISGHNFAPSPASDTVFVGGGAAEVGSATLTALTATVGSGATSGKVTVISPAGTGVSAEDFFLVPDGYTEWDVGFTGRAELGATTSLEITEPGTAGLLLFEGVEGQRLTVFVSGVTFAGGQVRVHAPDGSVVGNLGVATGAEGKLVLPPLAVTGTYTIEVAPGAGRPGAAQLRVLEEAAVQLQAGVAAPLTLARGQNGRFTFTGNAGETLGFGVPTLSTDPAGQYVDFTFYGPDGALLKRATPVVPHGWALPTLPLTGTYTGTVMPQGTAGASLALVVSQPNVAIVIVDGPPAHFESTAAGQGGTFSFVGEAGDTLALGVTAFTAPAGNYVSLTLKRPDGTQLWAVSANRRNSWKLPALPVAGTYTLVLQPQAASTPTLDFVLSRPITGTVATDGSAAVHETARVGQFGRYTFPGVAGRWFTLQGTSGALAGDSPASLTLELRQPSGAVLVSSTFGSGADAKLAPPSLPVTGTYTVAVDPVGATTGQIAFRLVEVAEDQLVPGDPAKVVMLGTAQNGRYAFAARAGDRMGLAVTSIATSPAISALTFKLHGPDGAQVWSGGSASPGSWQFPQLPSTGTYTLAASPAGTASASASLLLSPALVGTLAADGSPTVHDSTRIAQAGWYELAGTAGQRFTIQLTAGPLAGNVSATFYGPNGQLGTASLSSGTDTKYDLGTLAQSGTFAVKLVPQNLLSAARVALRAVLGATGELVVGDPPTTLVLGPAQNGRYTFQGTSGALLNVAITACSTTPAGQSVHFEVRKADGTFLAGTPASGAKTWQLPVLPATGTYTLDVRPYTTAAATATLQLVTR